jgi:oligoendopeptidase F
MKKTISKKKALPMWDLKQIYSSLDDPRIEQDMKDIEAKVASFAREYNTPDKKYLGDASALNTALTAYETLASDITPKPLYYLFYNQSIDSGNAAVHAKMALLGQRAAKIGNELEFFVIALGSIPRDKQTEFLTDSKLSKYRFLLECIFSDAQHKLSLAEEKILSLKNLPAKELWTSHNEKLLGTRSVSWKGRKIPLGEALNLISEQKTSALRKKLATLVYAELKEVAQFSEGEINAVFTDKKIDDELRGFKTPYESTVREYQNDPKVIEHLVKTVTDNFPIAHRFHALKTKLLKQKKLDYWDRAAKIGVTKSTYSFTDSLVFSRRHLARSTRNILIF